MLKGIPQEIQFRAAIPDDAGAIARLVNAAYRPAEGDNAGKGGWTHESSLVRGNRTSPDQVENLIATSFVLVGIMDATVVACAHIAQEGKEAHIGMLAVAPVLQGTGIGKTLLAQAEAHASTALNAEQLVLIVVSSRSELVDFYLRRGYQRTGAVLAYPVDAGVGSPIHGALDLEVLKKSPSRLTDR